VGTEEEGGAGNREGEEDMSGSLTGATGTGRGLRRTKEEYQAGERESERGLRKQREDCVSRGRAEEEERAERTAGVQEQREDCGSEDWGGLPRREEEGCRNKGGSVVARGKD
jgi:hypothetical protein